MYQGYLAADRKDIPFILETIAKNRPDYCVLSLPGSESLNARLAPYPNAFTLKRIPAPGHLAVTEKAMVGIAMYNGGGAGAWHLNALYCAPNKISDCRRSAIKYRAWNTLSVRRRPAFAAI